MQTKPSTRNGAQLIAQQLESLGIKYIFGIPGAKIDRLFDAIEDTSIQMVPVRHEANGAFMAGVIGRLTGKAGVTMVTSGPGCGNLVSGVATANSEGDPLIAIGGAVKRADQQKQTHQSMDTVSIFRSITKFSAEVQHVDAASEIMANAFRIAESGRPGACFLSLPQDVLSEQTQTDTIIPSAYVQPGCADMTAIEEAVHRIGKAKRCVVLLGLHASRKDNAASITRFLQKTYLPVVGTYQAAGTVDINYYHHFAGRVGLFNNQPGDVLLRDADLILTIGFSPIEYDPELWNSKRCPVIHLDIEPAEYQLNYQPCVEIVGNIAQSLDQMADRISDYARLSPMALSVLEDVAQQRQIIKAYPNVYNQQGFHPLTLIKAMQSIIAPDTTLCLDMGSFHIWIARYLSCFRARQMLISNGQQTMGVALPWAIGASLLNPGSKVVSVSGDGGFMQSSMELETAVRMKCNILHIVWVDNAYNMVEMQELKKYQRFSGVKFGPIDFKAYAESFGAKGFAVTNPHELVTTLKQAMDVEGPSVLAIPVDYSDNYKLMMPRTEKNQDPVFTTHHLEGEIA
ncbi:acetolactate synthase AlsS [Vibrio gazogenes]|uniref:Acetolactate synthase, large subunit n=1 Tax=Vibrio gazogenes DSM 21264 = NBRC 103151 TaxID=1123492 RepID=A0A1M5GEL0_VIBGA|nr:acetolactate synthase AlsS [Vibrio gazogenes]USP14635.1 acetolactate synthase AlsS [Vibrio gazogenes]SHG02173.1 acetolactate synthase, large subunit [Vibrio gazogenes DSM 21264] [Vibrio gazogenes DSM 21264 = NBRC 103151]SJN56061.1 Acetolactate synthase, catabolic [Vibrio gazogenes]